MKMLRYFKRLLKKAYVFVAENDVINSIIIAWIAGLVWSVAGWFVTKLKGVIFFEITFDDENTMECLWQYLACHHTDSAEVLRAQGTLYSRARVCVCVSE